MFEDEVEQRDWIIGIVVTLIVIGGLFWIRSQPLEEKKVTDASVASTVTSDNDRGNAEPTTYEEYVEREPAYRRSHDTIARVFECESNGQRILSDQPCGADATIRDIASPNRMDAQDTRVLYEPPPRSVQVQKYRAARQSPVHAADNKGRCAAIDEQRKQINEQMRRGYRKGEHYREQLRRLSAERWDLGCGRNDELR